MSEPTYCFTVFTPTYNRANTLQRVYDSLCVQTYRNFEWLVVDDGSSDDTHGMIASWRTHASFPIRYIYQENQGKHIAFNRGVHEAKGKLFLSLDSDDACVPNALERLKHHWDSIPDNQRHRFSAVTVLCEDETGAIHGSRFPSDVTDSDSIEIRYRFRVKGEKWGFHLTEILRQFPFPKVAGEKFVTEDIVWRAIARRYKTRYVNEVLRIYFNSDADQIGRLTKVVPKGQAKGRALYCESVLNQDLAWFSAVPGEFLRVAGNYARYAFHAGSGISKQASGLRSFRARLLWVLMLPVGYLLYRRDHSRQG